MSGTGAPSNGSPWISAIPAHFDQINGHPLVAVDMFTIGAPELAHKFQTQVITPVEDNGLIISDQPVVGRVVETSTTVWAESFTSANIADGPPIQVTMNEATGIGHVAVHLMHIGDYVKTFETVKASFGLVLGNGTIDTAGLGSGSFTNYGPANGWSLAAVFGSPGADLPHFS